MLFYEFVVCFDLRVAGLKGLLTLIQQDAFERDLVLALRRRSVYELDVIFYKPFGKFRAHVCVYRRKNRFR